MKITIEFSTENAAFGYGANSPEAQHEIARLLVEAHNVIHLNAPFGLWDPVKIKDSNGKSCGTVRGEVNE